jgi:hypothetical protein
MLKYNVQKSVILNCGHQIIKDEDIDIKMDDMRLPVVEASKYLGIMINKANEDDEQSNLPPSLSTLSISTTF